MNEFQTEILIPEISMWVTQILLLPLRLSEIQIGKQKVKRYIIYVYTVYVLILLEVFNTTQMYKAIRLICDFFLTNKFQS